MMFHIAQVTKPLFQARLGCLWPYSTAKLEARGAQTKQTVRRNTFARPNSATTPSRSFKSLNNTGVQKSQLGKVYNSCQTKQVLSRVSLREKCVLEGKSQKSVQLQKMGRMCSKKEGSIDRVPDVWANHFQSGYEFTCVKVYELMIRGVIGPIFGMNGECRGGLEPLENKPADGRTELRRLE